MRGVFGYGDLSLPLPKSSLPGPCEQTAFTLLFIISQYWFCHSQMDIQSCPPNAALRHSSYSSPHEAHPWPPKIWSLVTTTPLNTFPRTHGQGNKHETVLTVDTVPYAHSCSPWQPQCERTLAHSHHGCQAILPSSASLTTQPGPCGHRSCQELRGQEGLAPL